MPISGAYCLPSTHRDHDLAMIYKGVSMSIYRVQEDARTGRASRSKPLRRIAQVAAVALVAAALTSVGAAPAQAQQSGTLAIAGKNFTYTVTIQDNKGDDRKALFSICNKDMIVNDVTGGHCAQMLLNYKNSTTTAIVTNNQKMKVGTDSYTLAGESAQFDAPQTFSPAKNIQTIQDYTMDNSRIAGQFGTRIGPSPEPVWTFTFPSDLSDGKSQLATGIYYRNSFNDTQWAKVKTVGDTIADAWTSEQKASSASGYGGAYLGAAFLGACVAGLGAYWGLSAEIAKLVKVTAAAALAGAITAVGVHLFFDDNYNQNEEDVSNKLNKACRDSLELPQPDILILGNDF